MFLPGLARFLGSGQASLLLFRTFCLRCAVFPPSIRGSRPMLQYRVVLRTPRVTSACMTSVCRLISTRSLGSQVPLSRVGSLPGVAPSGPWTVCQLSSLLGHWLLPFALALVNLGLGSQRLYKGLSVRHVLCALYKERVRAVYSSVMLSPFGFLHRTNCALVPRGALPCLPALTSNTASMLGLGWA